jgi:hypothetical protein
MSPVSGRGVASGFWFNAGGESSAQVNVNEDGTECEVHEAYLSEEGMIEHNHHVVDARDTLFRDYAFDHRMSVYGEISQHLSDLFTKHAGGVSKFSFVQGLEQAGSSTPR